MSSTANQANTALPLHPAPDHGDRPRAEAGAARALDHTNSWKPPRPAAELEQGGPQARAADVGAGRRRRPGPGLLREAGVRRRTSGGPGRVRAAGG
ncbi:hypothetical protein HIM_03397 [Hirsutella minnesotensis 3608]|uniref:Uncharacterized protein n=1 Tax=Hirsutella minnesotensis 3608 TaxID=1043627 RepID=A0A0F7ZM95_9HYPO|nr:hypothetical protein HIM_03397 [Hirsutella minnesotensis 3608]